MYKHLEFYFLLYIDVSISLNNVNVLSQEGEKRRVTILSENLIIILRKNQEKIAKQNNYHTVLKMF